MQALIEKKQYLIGEVGAICAGCGIEGVSFDLDHKIPKAHGGNDDLGNLQLLCKPCHKGKTYGPPKNLTDDEWRALGHPQYRGNGRKMATITVSLSDEEKAKIESAARAEFISVAAYTKRAALKQVLRERTQYIRTEDRSDDN